MREKIDLSLAAPSAYLFTGEICTRAYKLNRFAFDFKYPQSASASRANRKP